MSFKLTSRSQALSAVLGICSLFAATIPCQAAAKPIISTATQTVEVPSGTAIPVVFTRTVNAAKAKPGEAVTAKTMQVVRLPDGKAIPSGTILIGHVVESRPFAFDSTPYAVQKPSYISIHFDQLAEKNGATIPVSLAVRALSSSNVVSDASFYNFRDETDRSGTRTLIGGDRFEGGDKQVFSPEGDIVGYVRKDGIYARLISNPDPIFACGSTNTEQSMGVFSPDACGLYGLNGSMSESGAHKAGTFTLESRRGNASLDAHSAALLQVMQSE
jgi:hypothetical protein